jgi:hypothetical protein
MNWVRTEDQMPESGKHILFAWKNGLDKWRISSGYWVDSYSEEAGWDWEGKADYHEEKDEYFIPKGWYEWGWELEYSAEVEAPSHWMGMPPTPDNLDLLE